MGQTFVWPLLHGASSRSLFVIGAITAGLALSGCWDGEGGSPRKDRSAKPRTEPVATKLVKGPPANVIEKCRSAARRTSLEAVYCPPIVPKGPVKLQTYGPDGGKGYYLLSFESLSLVDREGAMRNNPDFPNFPNRPRGGDYRWNRLQAAHWVVAAGRPARIFMRSAREDLLFPGQYHVRPRHFSVRGVRATVITGDIAGRGLASAAHAIVSWRIGGTGYLASVHFDHQAPVAERIARGLIRQMVDCGPRSSARRSPSCRWVFPTS